VKKERKFLTQMVIAWGCVESCAFWFIEDLREAGFKGVIFGVEEKVIEL
jgi:hypothetical protein